MKKTFCKKFVWTFCLFMISGCADKDKEANQTETSELWITLDSTTVEADENGQFQLTGKANYSGFSAKVGVKDSHDNISYSKRGILKIDDDGTFIWRNIYTDGNSPNMPVSFYNYKEKEKPEFQINVDYSKLIAKREEDAAIKEEIRQKMPNILEEIIKTSETPIIQITNKSKNYSSLVVTVPLDIKYETNGMKKEYMDSAGFYIQEQIADKLYPLKKNAPYLTFKYEKTNEFLGASEFFIRNRFSLYDKDTNY